MDEDTYLERFAARELGPKYFDHVGHLRMAWIHLSRYDVDEASTRVCAGIRELASKFGVPQKFNHTLSEALVRLMARRMQEAGRECFDVFLQAHDDLVSDCRNVLSQHYSDQRLHSAAAREGWVEPDRKPLDDNTT